MDMTTVIALVLGFIAGVVAVALVLPSMRRRTAARHQAEIDQYEQLVIDLRRERAADRETNRRLRHQLAIRTPQNYEHTLEERDSAIDELDKLHTELRQTTLELADRDRSLREARLAIHDIRIELERNRFAAAEAADAALEAVQNGHPPVEDDGSNRDAARRHELDGDDVLAEALDGQRAGEEEAELPA